MKTIEDQLSHLRLHGMHISWKAMMETRQHHKLSFSEGLEVLLQAEKENRINRRFERLKKAAKFRYQSSIEEIKLDASRGVDADLITELAKGTYLEKGESILITGATGCGKSFLASALGHQACSQGKKVLYYNLQKLLMQTKMARVDGSFVELFDVVSKTKLLIVDDFGLSHLEHDQQMKLMEIIE